jgi:hypothetical protein
MVLPNRSSKLAEMTSASSRLSCGSLRGMAQCRDFVT